MWNPPAGFWNHLVHFIICPNIIFLMARGSAASEQAAPFDVKWCHGYGPNDLYHQAQCYKTVHSFTAGSYTDMFETWNGLSTVPQRYIQLDPGAEISL